MQQQNNNNKQAQDKRKEFLKKEEMGTDHDQQDNAGDDSFTPIYLNSDTTLQTPEEKQHDETVHLANNDKVDIPGEDAGDTAFENRDDAQTAN